ncbi:MAG: CinA family nicotinamide mononucleotide deamidase-related protein [Candidatus Cloacimonetes bacterium]|nr:CinA family nicotinamide mononucleotide deamidase-related protein [Candidatus Cloacimonadota bacterium]
MKAGLISVGNELLLGQQANTNMTWLGKELAEAGYPLHSEITVSDSTLSITDGLDALWHTHSVVITTGGLGPTIDDDITIAAVAAYFNKTLSFDEEIWQDIEARFQHRGISTPNSNRKQAMVPENFSVLYNAYGTAPGLHYHSKGRHLFMLPGVPHEMRALVQNAVLPILREAFPAQPVIMRNLHTADLPESRIAEMTESVNMPPETNLAYLPQPGRVTLRVYGVNETGVAEGFALLNNIFRDWIWGYDDATLETTIQTLCIKNKLTLGLAESCTGGLAAARLTEVPGASEYFVGGIVTYSNATKTRLCGVSAELLDQHGAVSEPVAKALATGAADILATDLAGAVTGIAGPDGGTTEKPVGTVHIAVTFKGIIRHRQLKLTGSRNIIRQKSIDSLYLLIINMLKEYL